MEITIILTFPHFIFNMLLIFTKKWALQIGKNERFKYFLYLCVNFNVFYTHSATLHACAK